MQKNMQQWYAFKDFAKRFLLVVLRIPHFHSYFHSFEWNFFLLKEKKIYNKKKEEKDKKKENKAKKNYSLQMHRTEQNSQDSIMNNNISLYKRVKNCILIHVLLKMEYDQINCF